MRRLVRQVPVARSAVWTRRLAASGALLALAAVLLPRRGLTAWQAVELLGGGLGLATLSIPCAFVAAIVIWRTGFRGLGRAVAGLVLALLTLGYPAFLVVQTLRDRPVGDVSTDVNDPPSFTPSRASDGTLRAVLLGTADLGWLLGLARREPELDPVVSDQDPVQAYRSVLKVVTQLHWRVLAASAPTAKTPFGRVDAATYSAVMRLPEDIAIRIAQRDGQTRIDLRSASRFAALPLAGNDAVRNIQLFSDTFDDQDAEN